MTIEFKSAGSKMLAVSVPKEAFEPYIIPGLGSLRYHTNRGDMRGTDYVHGCETGFDKYKIIGLSTDHPEHHQAMKEARIYHQQPPKPNRFDYDSYGDRENAEYLMAMVRWGKSLLQVSECWILLKIKE